MFSFNNMNSGYSGYSMSNRAVDAYEDGEMPISKWRKSDIVEGVLECADENDIEISEELLNKLTKSELVDHFLYCSSWHHTSSYANATDFYSIDSDKIDESIEDEINKIISSRVKKTREKNEKKEPPLKVTALCEYNYWTGTRKHPKCNTVEEVLFWTEGDKMVQTNHGRKRMSSITELFAVKLKTKWLTKEALLKKKEIAEKKELREAAKIERELRKKFLEDIGHDGRKWFNKNKTVTSWSGNIYVYGRKPSSTDYEHQENFFYEGEHRIFKDADSDEVTYIFQTWDGKKWVNEPGYDA